MALTSKQLMASYGAFANQLTDFIAELGLTHLPQCDHIALRVNDTTTADQLRDALLQQGQLLSENIINGRPILIIKLQQPLVLGPWQVACIELPYPKNPVDIEGWEHAELVFPSTTVTDSTGLKTALMAQSPALATVFAGKTDIRVKASSPTAENERLANPTIAFKRQGICVKVHTHSIETIIASEQ